MTKHNRQQTTTRQRADQEPHASTYAIPAKSDIAPQTRQSTTNNNSRTTSQTTRTKTNLTKINKPKTTSLDPREPLIEPKKTNKQ